MKALLIIDMLRDFIYEDGALTVGQVGKAIIEPIKAKIEKFREEGNQIFYICDNHAKDDREFDMFHPHCIADTPGAKIIDELEVRKEDKIIKKRRYSAFFGTDLDLNLREKDVEELYLVGVCTNICVLYTAADARNLNYPVAIYKDCVASFDNEAHEFALKEAGTTLGCTIL
ncbi:MAG: cysteine hydrolase [Clostridiales bacterium]|nr:cysteine hydrolase [Clostridiales bacterium]